MYNPIEVVENLTDGNKIGPCSSLAEPLGVAEPPLNTCLRF